MTQELVLVVLLSGLAGLLWVMRLAIAEEKHSPEPHHESESSAVSGDVQPHERTFKHSTIAA
ncbi:MAG TPA: hypothetical protein VL261_12445 [Nitrospira sp.]|jgi:hypothetical protein|nr:hypothetical protein [Nitrospira sp.]